MSNSTPTKPSQPALRAAEMITDQIYGLNQSIPCIPSRISMAMIIDRETRCGELHAVASALRQYCIDHPDKILDIPDNIWLPFIQALDGSEHALGERGRADHS